MDLTHLHSIPPTVLDGQDIAEHVCIIPWCVGPPSVDCSVLTQRLTLVNVALSLLIPSAPARASPTQPKLLSAISLLVFTSVVFRSEVALLLVPIAMHAIQIVPFSLLVKRGFIAAAVSIGEDGHRSDMLPADQRKTKGLRSWWIRISGVNTPYGRNCTGSTLTSTKAKVPSGV